MQKFEDHENSPTNLTEVGRVKNSPELSKDTSPLQSNINCVPKFNTKEECCELCEELFENLKSKKLISIHNCSRCSLRNTSNKASTTCCDITLKNVCNERHYTDENFLCDDCIKSKCKNPPSNQCVRNENDEKINNLCKDISSVITKLCIIIEQFLSRNRSGDMMESHVMKHFSKSEELVKLPTIVKCANTSTETCGIVSPKPSTSGLTECDPFGCIDIHNKSVSTKSESFDNNSENLLLSLQDVKYSEEPTMPSTNVESTLCSPEISKTITKKHDSGCLVNTRIRNENNNCTQSGPCDNIFDFEFESFTKGIKDMDQNNCNKDNKKNDSKNSKCIEHDKKICNKTEALPTKIENIVEVNPYATEPKQEAKITVKPPDKTIIPLKKVEKKKIQKVPPKKVIKPKIESIKKNTRCCNYY